MSKIKKKKKENKTEPIIDSDFPEWKDEIVKKLIIKYNEEKIKQEENEEKNIIEDDWVSKIIFFNNDNVEWRSLNRMALIVRKRFHRNPLKRHFEKMDINQEVETKKNKKTKETTATTQNVIKESDEKIDDFKKSVFNDYFDRECKMLEKYCDLREIVPNSNIFETFLSVVSLICNHYKILYPCLMKKFLWESIYPKSKKEPHLPTESSFGKYFVKLFSKGKWRIVEVTDTFPYDKKLKKMLFPQILTSKYGNLLEYEHWISILLKGLIKLAGEGNEDLVLKDTKWIFQSLCGNFFSYDFQFCEKNEVNKEESELIKEGKTIKKVDDSNEKLKFLTFIKTSLDEIQNGVDNNSKFLEKIFYQNKICEDKEIMISSRKSVCKDDTKGSARTGRNKKKSNQNENINNISCNEKNEEIKKYLFENNSLLFTHNEKDENILKEYGLKASKLYSIIGISSYRNEILLRLLCFYNGENKEDYIGPYNYNDENCWNAGFENSIGFLKQDRINLKNLKDFWIPYSVFKKCFKTINKFFYIPTKKMVDISTVENNQNNDKKEFKTCYFSKFSGNDLKEELWMKCFSDENKTNNFFFLISNKLKSTEKDIKEKEKEKEKDKDKEKKEDDKKEDKEENEKFKIHLQFESYTHENSKILKKIEIDFENNNCKNYLIPIEIISNIGNDLLKKKVFKISVKLEGENEKLLETVQMKMFSYDYFEVGKKEEIYEKYLKCISFKESFPLEEYKKSQAFQKNEWSVLLCKTIFFMKELQKDKNQITGGYFSCHFQNPKLKYFFKIFLVNNNNLEVISENFLGKIKPFFLKKNIEGYTLMLLIKRNVSIKIEEGEEEENEELDLNLIYEKNIFNLKNYHPLHLLKITDKYNLNIKNELFKYNIFVGSSYHKESGKDKDKQKGAQNLESKIYGSILLNFSKFVPFFKIQLFLCKGTTNKSISANLKENPPKLLFENSYKNKNKILIPLVIFNQVKDKEKVKFFYLLKADVDKQFTLFFEEKQETNAFLEYQKNLKFFRENKNQIEEEKEEEVVVTKKVSSKKSKKKQKGKGESKSSIGGEFDDKKIRVPSKQDVPILIRNENNIQQQHKKINQSEADNEDSNFLNFTMNFTFSNPNIIVEKTSSRLNKIKNFIIQMDEVHNQIGRNKKGEKERKKFFLNVVKNEENKEDPIKEIEQKWKEVESIDIEVINNDIQKQEEIEKEEHNFEKIDKEFSEKITNINKELVGCLKERSDFFEKIYKEEQEKLDMLNNLKKKEKKKK